MEHLPLRAGGRAAAAGAAAASQALAALDELAASPEYLSALFAARLLLSHHHAAVQVLEVKRDVRAGLDSLASSLGSLRAEMAELRTSSAGGRALSGHWTAERRGKAMLLGDHAVPSSAEPPPSLLPSADVPPSAGARAAADAIMQLAAVRYDPAAAATIPTVADGEAGGDQVDATALRPLTFGASPAPQQQRTASATSEPSSSSAPQRHDTFGDTTVAVSISGAASQTIMEAPVQEESMQRRDAAAATAAAAAATASNNHSPFTSLAPGAARAPAAQQAMAAPKAAVVPPPLPVVAAVVQRAQAEQPTQTPTQLTPETQPASKRKQVRVTVASDVPRQNEVPDHGVLATAHAGTAGTAEPAEAAAPGVATAASALSSHMATHGALPSVSKPRAPASKVPAPALVRVTRAASAAGEAVLSLSGSASTATLSPEQERTTAAGNSRSAVAATGGFAHDVDDLLQQARGVRAQTAAIARTRPKPVSAVAQPPLPPSLSSTIGTFTGGTPCDGELPAVTTAAKNYGFGDRDAQWAHVQADAGGGSSRRTGRSKNAARGDALQPRVPLSRAVGAAGWTMPEPSLAGALQQTDAMVSQAGMQGAPLADIPADDDSSGAAEAANGAAATPVVRAPAFSAGLSFLNADQRVNASLVEPTTPGRHSSAVLAVDGTTLPSLVASAPAPRSAERVRSLSRAPDEAADVASGYSSHGRNRKASNSHTRPARSRSSHPRRDSSTETKKPRRGRSVPPATQSADAPPAQRERAPGVSAAAPAVVVVVPPPPPPMPVRLEDRAAAAAKAAKTKLQTLSAVVGRQGQPAGTTALDVTMTSTSTRAAGRNDMSYAGPDSIQPWQDSQNGRQESEQQQQAPDPFEHDAVETTHTAHAPASLAAPAPSVIVDAATAASMHPPPMLHRASATPAAMASMRGSRPATHDSAASVSGHKRKHAPLYTAVSASHAERDEPVAGVASGGQRRALGSFAWHRDQGRDSVSSTGTVATVIGGDGEQAPAAQRQVLTLRAASSQRSSEGDAPLVELNMATEDNAAPGNIAVPAHRVGDTAAAPMVGTVGDDNEDDDASDPFVALALGIGRASQGLGRSTDSDDDDDDMLGARTGVSCGSVVAARLMQKLARASSTARSGSGVIGAASAGRSQAAAAGWGLPTAPHADGGASGEGDADWDQLEGTQVDIDESGSEDDSQPAAGGKGGGVGRIAAGDDDDDMFRETSFVPVPSSNSRGWAATGHSAVRSSSAQYHAQMHAIEERAAVDQARAAAARASALSRARVEATAAQPSQHSAGSQSAGVPLAAIFD